MPSMAIGASFGRMVGIVVEALHESNPESAFFSACEPDVPCITPGTYAFLGAGAALSGIMHITVSVVVIMFELTGALTYILPTMIVVGVTKAVGERFGKGGIADRMIWFNGFPYLDNKEEHSFGVPVSKVMAPHDRLTILPASGTTLKQIERVLTTSDFQGFPIVKDHTENSLVGYIGKTELRYAVDRAKRDSFVPPEAICTFITPDSESYNTQAPAMTPAPIYISNPFSSPSPSAAPSPGPQPTLDLSRFTDFTPLSVHPSLPLETVLELFKKLGPRVILVEYRGSLTGLVTVKDCLKYQFTAEAAEHTRENARLAEKEERLWSWIKRAGIWTRGKVRGWTGGRVELGEPGEVISSTTRGGVVWHGGQYSIGGSSEAELPTHLNPSEDISGVGARGRDGMAVADPGLELEERFAGGGTGSS